MPDRVSFADMASNYLGTGLSHPLIVEQGKGLTVSDQRLIEQSIAIILETPKGTRFFLPDFGSRLSELLFEPNDEVVADLLKFFIDEAISEWERRIKIERIDTEIKETTINCNIQYRILQSNEVKSFIYPFYKKITY